MPKIENICQVCGKSFMAYPEPKRVHCSRDCYNVTRNGHTMVPCAHCGKVVRSYNSSPRVYCSRSCATTARNLTDWNPSHHRDISGEKNPMFGKGMSGADNPMFGRTREKCVNWKGGRRTRHDGYVLVIAPPDHPYPADSKNSGTKYILEHRHVVEQHLGRYLDPEEVVHHIDGNPTNNDLSNLKLYANQSDHVHFGHSTRKRN